MANQGIGLSALRSFSEAIDVTSNNIANGQTVGYKSAEYVFADQFFKAQNPQAKDRAGMGVARHAIRRSNTYGTITGTQNPLDLAIAGPGMFIVAKQVSNSEPTQAPEKFEYTRNGQFATDRYNRIVNQNGQFLVGRAADANGNIIGGSTSVLTLDQTPYDPTLTQKSTLEINLDNRGDSLATRVFNPNDTTSYNQAISQTVYDADGHAHTLILYYKKLNSAYLELTQLDDGTTFTYNPKQAVIDGVDITGAALEGEQKHLIGDPPAEEYLIASTSTADPAGTLELANAKLTYLSGGTDGEGSENAVYSLQLRDGTLLAAVRTADDGVFKVKADRYSVFATLDGNPVGPEGDPSKFITIGDDDEVSEQASLGTMAFVNGKNIDSLAKNTLGVPQSQTKMKINASAVADDDPETPNWNITPNSSVVNFEIFGTNTTAYAASGITYTNEQDGSATSQVTGYSFDIDGKLLAQYDNGKTRVKGQLLLATFNNFEGLIPVGNNSFAASAASGNPLTAAPNGSQLDTPLGSQLGAIRSQAIEESNVDLTQQLVRLMVLQRAYSAASQATKVQVAVLVDDTLRIGQ